MGKVTTKNIAIGKLQSNKGQIEGLPGNPRLIKDQKFDKLVKSIEENPEMLQMRELLVYPHGDAFVVIGGNMRLEAMKKLGYKECPCKVIPADATVEQLKAYTIKDNNGFGEWDFDMLANEWDVEQLEDWGLDLPVKNISETGRLSCLEYKPMYYEPTQKPTLKLKDCADFSLFNKKIKALDEYNLTDEQKETLKIFAYRFIKIDFESVANYYYFNASEEEQKAIERLRLVLIENGENGFIEDDLLRILTDERFDNESD